MNVQQSARLSAAAAAVACLLAACGGGGSGGGGSSGGGSADTPLPATASNTVILAAEAYQVGNLGAVPILASGAAILDVGAQLWLGAAGAAPTIPPSNCDAPPTGSTLSQGTLTVTYKVKTVGTFTAGDLIYVEYKQCLHGSALLDGELKLSFRDYSKNSSNNQEHLAADVTMTQFTAANLGSGVVETLTGSIYVTADNSATDQTTYNITNGQLLAVRSVGGKQKASRMLTNYQYNSTLTEAQTVENYSLSVEGGSFPSLSDKYITWSETGTGITAPAGHQPNAGTLKVLGAKNSSLTMTFNLDASVSLSVDADGNGIADGAPQTVTWSQLIGAL